MNCIKDRPEGLKLQNLALATMTGPAVASRWVTETIDPSREYIGNCTGFLSAYVSSSTSFLPKMLFECCMILHGTLGSNFDIFLPAVLGYSTEKPLQDQVA